MTGLGRLTSSVKVLAGACASVVTLLGYMWLKQSVEEKWYYKPAPCHYPADVWEDYLILLQNLPRVLAKLHIPYFLCYGSLWGAIRYQRALDWDADLDLCVWTEDVTLLDPAHMLRVFRWENFSLEYNSREGKYVVRFGKVTADLVVFDTSSDGEWLERVGWENWLFSSLASNRFPARLALRPLPTMRFHGLDLPVPKGEIEIMKYFYPDDWWMEMKPPGC